MKKREIIIVAILAVVGLAVYWFFIREKPVKYTTVLIEANWLANDYRILSAKVKDGKYEVFIRDTVREGNKPDGKPVLDSAGKSKMEWFTVPVDKDKILVDYGRNYKPNP